VLLVADDERDLLSAAWMASRASAPPTLVVRGAPISSSGKVMKKRQPKVVPKKAPSTAWKRELGGV